GLPPHAFVVQRKGPSLRQRAALFGRRHGLTPRQVEVLVALVDGRTNKEIAAALGIQEKTVELHVTAILRKTGAEKRSELITAFRPTPSSCSARAPACASARRSSAGDTASPRARSRSSSRSWMVGPTRRSPPRSASRRRPSSCT